VAGMAIMIDGRDIDARQLPAARTQPYAELHLLAAVQIAVAKVAGRRNGLAAIQAAAVEMVYDPGQPVGIVRARPFDVFEILGFALDDDAADAGELPMIVQEAQRGRKKVLVEPHVAVDQTDEAAAAVLIAELHAGAASTVGDPVQPHDGDRIA